MKEVHKRRYLLQPIAIEAFAKNGLNYFLALEKHNRAKVEGCLGLDFFMVNSITLLGANQSFQGTNGTTAALMFENIGHEISYKN